MSNLNPEKLANYIQIRYNTRLDKEKLIELLKNYNSTYEESQQLLINMIFKSLFGLTLDSLNNVALSYNGRELSLDDSIKELQPEGRKRMDVKSFLAGHKLTPGSKFFKQ